MTRNFRANVREVFELSVKDARRMHERLVEFVRCGRGSKEWAMRVLEQRFGLSFWAQQDLHYRPERKPSIPFLLRLREAYLSALERSVRRDLEVLKAEKARGDDAADLERLLAEAEALVAELEARSAELKERRK